MRYSKAYKYAVCLELHKIVMFHSPEKREIFCDKNHLYVPMGISEVKKHFRSFEIEMERRKTECQKAKIGKI